MNQRNEALHPERGCLKKKAPAPPALLLLCTFSALLVAPPELNAYLIMYKEQYYRLFHVHYNQYPDDTVENIYWLERALKAQFANPLYASALIETEDQYEKYRYLFMMHLNIKMTEQYLYLANKYNKRRAYFFNAPWKDENLKSLDIAETCFENARYYWAEAASWAEKARDRRFRFMRLHRIEFWEDEAYRIIELGTLDYGKTIDRELVMLRSVREQFQAMEGPAD
ncbi:MAG: hypothetical protein LBD31_08970 [Treponema sp.]|jgi:hypothetical protein|nr:hypothetical protein [Treponema sp.]